MSSSIFMKRKLIVSVVLILLGVGELTSATKEALKALDRLNTLLLQQSALDCQDIADDFWAKGRQPLSGAYYFYQYSSYVYCKFESQGPKPQGVPGSWTVLLRSFGRKDHRHNFRFENDLKNKESSGNFEGEFRMGARILEQMLSNSNLSRNYQVAIETSNLETKETSRLVYDLAYFNETDIVYGNLPKKTAFDGSVGIIQYKDLIIPSGSNKQFFQDHGRKTNYQLMVRPNPDLK